MIHVLLVDDHEMVLTWCVFPSIGKSDIEGLMKLRIKAGGA